MKQRAFDNIEKYYALVGLLEMKQVSFQIMQKKFPNFFESITKDEFLELHHHKMNYEPIEVTPEIRKQFCTKYSQDCELHEFIKRRLLDMRKAMK